MKAELRGNKVVLSENPKQDGGFIFVGTQDGNRRLEIREGRTEYDLPHQVTPIDITSLAVGTDEAQAEAQVTADNVEAVIESAQTEEVSTTTDQRVGGVVADDKVNE